MEVVITAYRGAERHLLGELKELGRFERTGFRDVIKGEVEDFDRFLEEIEKRPFLPIAHVTPIRISFTFYPEDIPEKFKEMVEPLINEVKPGETFCIKVNRRGMKGIVKSQELAKEVGTFVWKRLRERDGAPHKVSLEDPDKAIVIETIGNWCGIGIIPREKRKEHYCLRL